MRLLPLLLLLALHGQVWGDLPAVETSEECLNRLTLERKQQICWMPAEGPGQTISDDSQKTQAALDCEKNGEQVALTDAEMQTCFKQAPDNRESVDPDVVPAPPTPIGPSPNPRASVKANPQIPVVQRHKSKPDAPIVHYTTTPEPAETAQLHADQDLAACTDARSQASQCCNNPLSCASSLSVQDQASLAQLRQQTSDGPKSGQSIADYCAQMQQASTNSGNVNNALASSCYSGQNSCTSLCQRLVGKYQSLVNNCDGDCDASEVYLSTLASLEGAVSTCQGLSAQATALARQGIGSASGQAYGSLCQQQASYSPQSAGGGTSAGAASAGFANSGAARRPSCADDPSSPTCAAIADAQAEVRGKVGFRNAAGKREDSSGFDTGSLAATNAKLSLETNRAAPGSASQVTVVPNNTGGVVPGQENAFHPVSRSGTGTQTVSATNTDIMRGHLAGGYSQSGGSGFESFMRRLLPGRSLAGAKGVGGYMGMDLKKFMPNRREAELRLAILSSQRNPEINGKGVNLFNRVSEKIEEKCRLGVL